MTDSEILAAIDRAKASARKHSIIIIAGVVVLAFILLSIFKVFPGSNTKENRELRKEIKALQLQMDSLNTAYSTDSIDRVKIIEEQEVHRAERAAMAQEIRTLTNQLSKFNQRYANIPKYNIPDDSLLRIFNKTFDY